MQDVQQRAGPGISDRLPCSGQGESFPSCEVAFPVIPGWSRVICRLRVRAPQGQGKRPSSKVGSVCLEPLWRELGSSGLPTPRGWSIQGQTPRCCNPEQDLGRKPALFSLELLFHRTLQGDSPCDRVLRASQTSDKEGCLMLVGAEQAGPSPPPPPLCILDTPNTALVGTTPSLCLLYCPK